ncbi:MAG: DUF5810 domain-containing protein [Halobacteriaceae archaeon]
MGYACPVCSDPQADGEHLANHLAFTAIGGDDAHEAFLDETVPDWGERDPAALADAVVDHAEEVDLALGSDGDGERAPEANHDGHPGHGAVDATGRGDRGRPDLEDALADQTGYGRDRGHLDADAADVLAEARELTARMRGESPAGDASGSGDDDQVGDDASSETE